MDPLGLGEVVAACQARLVRGAEQAVAGISIDSRTLHPGDLYIAIRGKRLDGHEFVEHALRAGACGVVVAEDIGPGSGFVVRVRDTTEALGRIAALYRSKMRARVVAVTGSNGKTTTKEMLATLLANRYRTLKPESSYNNDIGVPLTVLRMDRTTGAAVFELEMNELGGTTRLARICRPEVGVVTNIGDTHLEFMRDRAGVAKEKAELLQELPGDGVAVLNADDPLVAGLAGSSNARCLVFFGLEREANVFVTEVSDLGLDGVAFRLLGQHETRVLVPGRHSVMNFLAAAAAANALGVDFTEMPEAIERFVPPPMRLQVKQLGSVVLIEDCYNANPQSVRAALAVLARAGTREQSIALLGDMLELGDSSPAIHEELGRELAGVVSRLVLVGPMGEHTARGAQGAGLRVIHRFDTSVQAREAVFDLIEPGDRILVKGSRAIGMELVSQEIVRHYGQKYP